MANFSFEAVNASGILEKGELQAETKKEAVKLLARDKKTVLFIGSIEKQTGSKTELKKPRVWRNKDLAFLFSDMSFMLNAGFTIDAVLECCLENKWHKKQQVELQRVYSEFTSGKPLNESLKNLSGLSDTNCVLIHSALAANKLQLVCKKIANFYEEQERRQNMLIDAMLYPSILVSILMLTIIGMALWLVPALEPVFSQSPDKLPTAIIVLSFLREYVLTANFLLIITAFILLWFVLKKFTQTRFDPFSPVFLFPFFKTMRVDIIVSTYFETLSMLLENGGKIVTSLELACGTINDAKLEKTFELITEKVSGGERFSTAFSESNISEFAVCQLIITGENTNALPFSLARSAEILRAQTKRKIDNMSALISPLLTVVLGVLIGGLVISVMTAVLDINELAIQ